MMNTKFRCDIADDPDFEDLIAEIYYEDQFVLMLTQEQGFNDLRIEIYPPKLLSHWDFSFTEFYNTICHAQKRLQELRNVKGQT